jgi:integrase
MDNSNIELFLNYLAAQRRVGASTQNQALCALIFMYRYVIKRDIENLNYGFAKRPKNIPTVLSPQEVAAILRQLDGKYWLMTALLYGCGFRIHETLSLRIKDIDQHNRSIFVFRGKGCKDRYTLLLDTLLTPIQQQIALCKDIHQADLSEGHGFTSIESSLKRKYGNSLMDFA